MNITGNNLYKSNNQNIYYDKIVNRSFIVEEKDNILFIVFDYLFPVSLLITIYFSYIFKYQFVVIFIVLLAIYFLLNVIFKGLFIYKLKETKEFNYKKDKLLSIYSKCNGIHKFIIYSLLHIGIIVYTILFSMKDNVDKLNLYSAYLVIGICTVFIIINIVTLIIKVKDK